MPRKSTKVKGEASGEQRKLFEKLLAKACFDSDFSAAQSLLKQHPDLALDSQPLLNAAFSGSDKIIKLLLDAGADPNAVSKTAGHLCPLHRICEFKKTAPRHEGHETSIKHLLDAGADPTIRAGYFRLTPLAMAAFAGYADLTNLLSAKTRTGEGDIFHAAAIGDETRVTSFLKKDPTLAKRPDINDFTPLMYCGASRLGHTHQLTAKHLAQIARLLLAAGADPNASVTIGEHTRSLLSLSTNHPAVFKLLLDAGAEAGPALISALWDADYDTAKLLLDYGANPKDPQIAKYVGGFAHWGHFDQSRWLIEHGAPVDAVDKYNTTALQAAARRGARGDFIEFLLERNANPLLTTLDNQTPYDLAKEHNKTKLLPLLQKAMDRATLLAPGKDTSEDDEFEADLPQHMRSKRPRNI